METSMAGGIGGALKRKLTGESAFMNFFTALNDGEKIAIGHTFPGHIVPVSYTHLSLQPWPAERPISFLREL